MSYIGIEKDKTKKVATALNDLLATYSVYYQNLRAFHWHVKGQNFFELHQKFEELYDDAKVKIDEIAERILTLGHLPLSHMSEFIKHSKIKEADYKANDKVMVTTILKNQQEIIKLMRKVIKHSGSIDDDVTADLITGIMSETEKRTWMLAAWSRNQS